MAWLLESLNELIRKLLLLNRGRMPKDHSRDILKQTKTRTRSNSSFLKAPKWSNLYIGWNPHWITKLRDVDRQMTADVKQICKDKYFFGSLSTLYRLSDCRPWRMAHQTGRIMELAFSCSLHQATQISRSFVKRSISSNQSTQGIWISDNSRFTYGSLGFAFQSMLHLPLCLR